MRDGSGTYRPSILIDLEMASARAYASQTLSIPATVPPVWLHVEYRESDSSQDWIRLPVLSAERREVYIQPVETGGVYDFRLRYVSELNRASDWTTQEDYTVVGTSTAPPDVTELNYRQPDVIDWLYPVWPLDLKGFQVRYNDGTDTVWSRGTPAHDGYLSATTFSIGTFSGGTTTWLVKAFDTSLNESANPAYIVRDLGDPVSEM